LKDLNYMCLKLANVYRTYFANLQEFNITIKKEIGGKIIKALYPLEFQLG